MTTFARHGARANTDGRNQQPDGRPSRCVLNVKLLICQLGRGPPKIAARYNELLRGVGDVITPKVVSGRDHVYHLYVIRTARRDGLKNIW